MASDNDKLIYQLHSQFIAADQVFFFISVQCFAGKVCMNCTSFRSVYTAADTQFGSLVEKMITTVVNTCVCSTLHVSMAETILDRKYITAAAIIYNTCALDLNEGVCIVLFSGQ